MITRILLMGMWSKDMSSLIWCLVVCELEFQKCSRLAESSEWQCQKHPRKKPLYLRCSALCPVAAAAASVFDSE